MSDTTPEPSSELPPTRTSSPNLQAVPGTLSAQKDIVTIVREWAGITIAVVVLFASFAGWVTSTAHAQTVDATKSLVEAHQALERRFDEHVRDSGQVERDLKEDVHQLRLSVESVRQQQAEDIRSLYQAIRTGRPQPALEADAGGGR